MYSNLVKYVPNRKPPMGAVLNPYLPINRGLVLNSIMWEGAGNIVSDLSGNGNNLDAFNSPVWSSGKYGSSILYDDGSSQYHFIAKTPVTTVPLTIICSFQSNDGTVDQCLVDIADDSTINEHFQIILDSSGGVPVLVLARSRSGIEGIDNATSPVSWSINTSHHVAAVFATTTSRLCYLDGVPGSENTAINIPLDIDSVTFGKNNRGVGSLFLSGILDYVMIYNRALSASEIAELYREPFCGFRWPNIIELASWVEAVGAANPWNYYAQIA